jgi:hypothetical protein
MFGLNRELQILDGQKREVRVLTGKIKSFIITIGSTRRNCCEKRSTQIPIMFCHDKSNGNVSCRLHNWSVPKGQLASVVTNSTMAMTRSKIRWSPCKKNYASQPPSSSFPRDLQFLSCSASLSPSLVPNPLNPPIEKLCRTRNCALLFPMTRS